MGKGQLQKEAGDWVRRESNLRRDSNAHRKGDASSEKTNEWPLLKAILSAG